jgi:hypothetical protein
MIRHRMFPRLFPKSILPRPGQWQRPKPVQLPERRRSSSYEYEYVDPTLSWAKENPNEAQGCLQPPGWDISNCDPDRNTKKIESLEDYCQWRKWSHSSPSSELHEQAVAISSHVLSAPLTLANFYYYDAAANEDCGVAAAKQENETTTRWCCVGARAEATLPYDYWKEFLLLGSAMAETAIHVSVDFVGPDIQPTTPSRTIELEDDSSLSLRWYYKGLLHETTTTTTDPQWDAYIFLNPGFGHANLQDGWHPTLERVIEEERSILLTAHSELDSLRDSEHLKQRYGLDVNYSVNPFASRITYQDPFDKDHIVRPNHYVAHVLVQ